MEKITAEKGQNFFTLAKRMKMSKSPDILVFFKKGAGVYRGALNLKILKSIAEQNGKSVKFEAEDQKHKDFIDSVNEGYAEYSENQIEINTERKFSKPGFFLFGVFVSLRSKLCRGGRFKQEGRLCRFTFPFKPVLVIFLLLGALFGVLFALWWYIPGATVKVKVDSKGLIKLLDIKAVSGGEVSKEKFEIPASVIEAEASDAQSIPTTGKKEVGEKAKGEITVYNKTSKNISIKKGISVTLIATEGEALKYETTESVEVPALTEEITTEPEGEVVNKVYGKKDIKISAKSFGNQYDLDKEQKFEIEGYDADEMVGENFDKITGGSLEELNVVLQSDLDALSKILADSTRGKAKDALYKKIVEGQKLPEPSINYEVLKSDYSARAGDEADEVNLTFVVKSTGLVYSDSDLEKLVKELIVDLIPKEYVLNEEDPEYEVAATKSEEAGTVNLQIKLKSYITPRLNEDKIKADLTGMSINQAQEYLDQITDVSGFEIFFTPGLPELFRTMPHRTNNIVLEIEK